MFDPINPPPTEHHALTTGQSTEFGDNAKVAMQKINAGFKHVYSVLAGMGATLADEIEYVAKSEFDALVHELEEVKADLANVKMMVQGLGFAGAPKVGIVNTITDPSHSMIFSDPVVTVVASEAKAGLSWDGLAGSSEPTVTVNEVPES